MKAYHMRPILRFSLLLLLVLLSFNIAGFAQEIKREQPPSRPSPLFSMEALIFSASAQQLALAMDVPLQTLVSASLGQSDTRGAGIGDSPLGFFFPRKGNTFTILSTGFATSADDPDTNNNEVLGSGIAFNNVSAILSGLNNTAGYDLVQLTLHLKPPDDATSLSFDFAFFSEEFPEFYGFTFNDTFTAELAPAPDRKSVV